MTEHYLINGLLLLILGICLYTDIAHRKIYNRVILSGLLPGLVLVGVFHGFSGMLDSLLGLAVGIGLLFVPFALGGIGAGDVKLLGLVGALKGMEFVFYTFLSSAILGGGLAILILIKEKQLLQTVLNVLSAFRILLATGFRASGLSDLKSAPQKMKMPFGPVLCLGSILCFILL